MKKVFAILAVVAFVACNSGENKDAAADTTATVDTAAVAVDTTATADTTAVDTTATADTTTAAH